MVPRFALLVVAVVVARLGLVSSRRLPEAVGDPLGDVFYAALVVVLVLVVRPRTRPLTAGLVGLALCAAVETLQLTRLPETLAARWPQAELLLGTTFSAVDLLWYAAGAALGTLAGALVLAAVDRRHRPSRPPRSPRPSPDGHHT